MTKSYDKHYKKNEYFGDPYPELIQFFRKFPNRGKLLDLGCGQGRNAIPLAKLGYEVIGIDSSKVGIQCLLEKAKSEIVNLKGKIEDIYKIDDYSEYDFILLDSMFHFLKKYREKETNLIKRIISTASYDSVIVFCIPNSGNKVKILNDSIDHKSRLERLLDIDIKYMFSWEGEKSDIDYKIVAVKK